MLNSKKTIIEIVLLITFTLLTSLAMTAQKRILRTDEVQMDGVKLTGIAQTSGDITAGSANDLANAAAVKAAIEAAIAALPAGSADSTRLVGDSILVYYQAGSEVGRDTLRGLGGDGGIDEPTVRAIAGDSLEVARQYADENDQTRDYIPEITDNGAQEIKTKVGNIATHIYNNGDSKIESRSNFAVFVSPAFIDVGIVSIEANHPIVHISGDTVPGLQDCDGTGSETFVGTWLPTTSPDAFNGRSLTNTTSGDYILIPLGANWIADKAVIYCRGDVNVSFRTGGTVENGVTRNSDIPGRIEIPYTAGTSLLIQANSGTVEVLGIHYLSDEPIVHNYNMGRSGSRTFTWFPNHESSVFTQLYDTLSAPDLVVLDFGTNDVIDSDSATFAADYARTLDYWTDQGAEIIAVGAPTKRTGSPVPQTPLKVIDRISYEAATKRGIKYISHYQIYGGYATATEAGPPGVFPDGVHFSSEYGQKNVQRILREITGRISAGSGGIELNAVFQIGQDVDDATDFNTLTDAGVLPKIYLSSNPNGPPVTGASVHFYVHNIKRSGDVIQSVYPLESNRSLSYQRILRSGVWGPWLPLTSGRAFNAGNTSVDWNTLQQYGLANRIHRGNAVNGPGDDNFFFVNNYRRADNIYQEALPYTSGLQKRWRTFDGTTWSAWSAIPATAANTFGASGVAANTVDWNTLQDVGTVENIIRGDNPNGPTPGTGVFYIATNWKRGNRIFQEARRYDNSGAGPAYLYRTYSGTAWSAWMDAISRVETEGLIQSYVQAPMLVASASLDFPETASPNSSAFTISVAGASVGDPVILGGPIAPAGTNYDAQVSSSGVVTVTFYNHAAAAINPVPATFKVKVLK